MRLHQARLLDRALRRTPRDSRRRAGRRINVLLLPLRNRRSSSKRLRRQVLLRLDLERTLKLLLRKHHVTPFTGLPALLAHRLRKHRHPPFFILAVVRVEVDDLAVAEADPEPLFYEHVAFFLFSEGRLATRLAAFVVGIWLHERGLVVDELDGFGEFDARAWLAGHFVVSGKLGAVEAEEAAAPVL